jgi:spermidine synthase
MNRSTRAWAVILMALSGFAALGYQIVWTQQNAHWLGHESAAMLAIVAAFFGGIGFGALALGRRIDASARPALWYAACEVIIGVWALALVVIVDPASRVLLGFVGIQPAPAWHWFVAFAGTSLLLLPATVAMGATFPAMERVLAAVHAERVPIALLYAANTLGAVIGVLVTAFVLVPRIGLASTAIVCAAASLLCAGAAPTVFARNIPPAAATGSGVPNAHLTTLAITGLLGIGYEVVVVRVLSQVAENTVFTFAIALAVYLVGTALGAAWWSRSRPEDAQPAALRDRLLRWQALACLLGVLALAFAPTLKSALVPMIAAGVGAALAVECLLACAAFLVPTMVMGALFSELATQARAAGASLGVVLGANTFGAALAPLLIGVVAVPELGAAEAAAIVAIAYLSIASRRAWTKAPQLLMAAASAAFVFFLPPMASVQPPPGGRIVSKVDGVAATVSVVEDAAGVATLHINNRQQEGSSATLFADARQGLIPTLLHPRPRRVLFLGLGTGATVRSAALDPATSVTAVELLPEVIAASTWFARTQQAPAAPNLKLLAADARRFVRAAPGQYDVIVSDNFHPARSGSASLYTAEHFAAVRERLAPGGVFCQWLPLHQLDMPTLRSIVRTFSSVYPRSWAVLATHSLDTPIIGLVARKQEDSFDRREVRARLSDPAVATQANWLGLDDDFALLGTFVAGPAALEHFGEGAPLNTDDRPIVAYLAPRITYEPTTEPRDRLLELLAAVDIRVDELLSPEGDTAWDRRLANYWSARDRYLEIGRKVTPSPDVREMLAQVRSPLLEVLRISADFRPAFGPLERMAHQLERIDAQEAHALLTQLTELRARR